MLPDPSIVIALQHALSSPPAVMRAAEATDVGRSFSRFRARNEARIAQMEADTAAWIAQGVEDRETLWASFRDHPISAGHLQALDSFIQAVDERVASDAREFAHFDKRFRKMAKLFNAHWPQHAALVEAIMTKTLATMARGYSERADMALYLRALRAEHDPAARGGPIFDDPRALRRHLRAALA